MLASVAPAGGRRDHHAEHLADRAAGQAVPSGGDRLAPARVHPAILPRPASRVGWAGEPDPRPAPTTRPAPPWCSSGGCVEPGVLPAWVAEMDYALAEPITAALHDAVRARRGRLPAVRAGRRRARRGVRRVRAAALREPVDPGDRVLPTADVTVGVRIALDVLSERAPMVLPLPAYDPQHGLGQITGREQWDLPVDPDGDTLRRRPRRPRPRCSRAVRGRCCSPSRTTRAATCTPAPSSRGSATS